MAEFVCKFGMPNGEILQRVYTSESEKSLRDQMEQQGFYIFGIQRRFGVENVFQAFSFRRRKVTGKEFLVFNQELAALIHAGLPLLQCLELLMERIDNPEFSVVLRDVYAQVKSGVALSEAFSSYPDVFPRVYTASILAGEKSGTVENVIRRYMSYVKITLAIRTKVISSLVYPLLLLGLSCAVIGILVGYVIPKFSEFYSGVATSLPLVTQLLVSGARFFRANFAWVLLGIALLILVLRTFVVTSEAARLKADKIKLSFPFLGRLWTKFSISQLMRTLYTLLSGGIPLVNSIDVAADAVGNRLISRKLGQVSQGVKEGESLWISLQKTGLMTHMAVEMVKVGEETGALEEMLKNISDFYDDEIDTNLTSILAIVEPVMLMIMGLIIATILLAMYYPLFSIYQTIQ